MPDKGKIVVVSQYYPPDRNTTAAILSTIAEHLARQTPVLVLSGTAGSGSLVHASRLSVVEVKNWVPAKAALVRRAAAEILLSARMFLVLLRRLHREDVALAVTAPFMLPYAVVAAAKLKRAKSVLIMHDLFPDVLVVAGILRPNSLIARAIRGANYLMFRALNSIVVIGQDTRHLLLPYGDWIREKIRFIPNWATLPVGVRTAAAENPFRRLCKADFIVGLSGNLGFTHDPLVVFDAARSLREDPTIHFLLSGWGIGFDQLRALQAEQRLPNVTLVERVADEDLEQLLSAADVWVIPYRKNVAGVSIPSRFYNLLAIGRPVVLVSEPGAEAAMTVTANNLGWVVPPGRPDELATALRDAFLSRDPSMGERAAAIAGHFSLHRALAEYASLMQGLLRDRTQPGGLP